MEEKITAVDFDEQGNNAEETFGESGVNEAEDQAGYSAGEPEQGTAAGETAEEKSQQDSAEQETIDLAQLLGSLKSEYEREKAVAAEYLRRLQQLQADYDNYRKRTQREKEELAKYAAEKIIVQILPVLDNLERGLSASRQSSDLEGLARGVDMIFRQLTAILEKEGLTAIEAVGREFDPAKHEAVMQVESADCAPNTVVEELQKGYFLKEKVLRPSMVKVAQ